MENLTREDVLRLLPMQACIDVMEGVLAELAAGEASQPLRSMLPLADEALFAQMPALLRRQGVVGAKLITIVHKNHALGLPSHQGVVALFDAEHGSLLAVVDAQSVTAIRTAAVSGVATKWLARQDATTLAILGTGEQARTHVEAVLLVRPIERVTIWGRHRERAVALQTELAARGIGSIEVCDSAEAAVAAADVICTVTGATEPILNSAWVKDGAHVNVVGACRPSDREVDTALVQRARLFVDRVESALHEAGDIIIPIGEGAITEAHIVAELGDVVTGRANGRVVRQTGQTSDAAVTVFKSLGLAVQDLAAANFVYGQRGQQA